MTADQVLLAGFVLGGALLLSGVFWTSVTLLALGSLLLLAAFIAGPALDRRWGR